MSILIEMILNYPKELEQALATKARLTRTIEELEEEDDPDELEDDDEELEEVDPDLEGDFAIRRQVIELEAKIETHKILLKEASGNVSKVHQAQNARATISSIASAGDSDRDVVKMRLALVDMQTELKLLSIKNQIAEWHIGSKRRASRPVPVRRESTAYTKKLAKAVTDLEKTEASIQALQAKFECYKLLVTMGITEI